MLRFDIINWLIEKYGYKSYLEIGVAEGECFDKITVTWKTGVDPALTFLSLYENLDPDGDIYDGDDYVRDSKGKIIASGYLCKMTSDEHFGYYKRKKYDIIFIDGEHLEAQVMRDIDNSLKRLSPGGTIVVHDCNPPTEAHAAEVPTVKSATGDHYLWNGTVWKAWVKMRMSHTSLQCRCVDADWGCGIMQVGEQLPVPDDLKVPKTFDEFAAHRKEYLNLITVDKFKEIYK